MKSFPVVKIEVGRITKDHIYLYYLSTGILAICRIYIQIFDVFNMLKVLLNIVVPYRDVAAINDSASRTTIPRSSIDMP